MDTLSTIDTSAPLCVDLDGTLVKIDTLHQGILDLIRKNPKYFFKLFFWMNKGRATLKQEVMKRLDINAHLYPYNKKFIRFLLDKKKSGQQIILVTAANHRTAKSIAEYLNIFDDIHSSTDNHNLFGSAKRDLLIEKYESFDYAGDSIHDLPIFEKARIKIFVNPDKKLKKHKSDIIINERNNFFTSIVKALRLHQWLKNILLFTPMLLAHQLTNINSLYNATLAFLAFGLTASSVYIINDLLDLTSDQSHQNKCNRPFAAGDIQLVTGLYIIPILLIGAFSISVLLPPGFSFILLLYLLLANSYSLVFKQIIIFDIILLTTLYILRIISGSLVTNDEISLWFFAFIVTLFLSLALAKRCMELVDLKSNNEANIIYRNRGYKINNYPFIFKIGVGIGFLSILIILGYILSPTAQSLYSKPSYLWFLIPIIGYWQIRLWTLIKNKKIFDDPLHFAITDKKTYFIAVLIFIVIYLSI